MQNFTDEVRAEQGRGTDQVQQYIALFFRIVSILALCLSTALAVRYSGQHILEEHAFRQTQTAVTSFWLCRTGFKLAYETPVIGYPWSIPFEFPLYQYLVAKLACSLGLNLERTGRLLSYAFLLACLLPISRIMKSFFATTWKLHFWVFTALFLTSPLYLFWGRSFMIETAALFFSLCFLSFAIQLLKRDFRWRNVLGAAVFLTLGMLQKSTTILPVLMIVSLLFPFVTFHRSDIRINSAVLWKLVIALIVPFLVGCAWIQYSDYLKAQNAFGASLTSSALFVWNFGTLSARLSRQLWIDVVFKRVMIREVAGLGFLVLPLAAIFLRGKERILVALSFVTFVSFFLIFENLHFWHDYYQTANGIYLILAVAIAITSLLEKYPKWGIAITLFFAAVTGANLRLFRTEGYHLEKMRFDANNNETLAVSKFVRENTDPDKPILVYGYDWSSEFSFFSERKSFTVAAWFNNYTDPIQNPVRYLGQEESAVVLCGTDTKYGGTVEQCFRPKSKVRVKGCYVFLK